MTVVASVGALLARGVRDSSVAMELCTVTGLRSMQVPATVKTHPTVPQKYAYPMVYILFSVKKK